MAITSRIKQSYLFQTQCYIGGQWRDADNKTSIDVYNPADRSLLGTIPAMGTAETTAAINAAYTAFPSWGRLTGKERSGYLHQWFELMLEHAEDLAAIMTLEQGKPLTEARSEIHYAASFVEWFSEEAKRVYGHTILAPKQEQRITVIKQPIGVTAAITPWNFPSAMITRKVAAALAAGCTIVVKPDQKTPYSALALAKLAEMAKFPAGVFNIVTGDAKAIGLEMTTNPLVRKISFTGSSPVGKLLLTQSAGTLKKISLELGGNAPFIVFEDADLDKAVKALMASKFRNTGQTCVCANRILVQDSIYNGFCSKLSDAMKSLKPGHGFEEGVNQGPLITEEAVKKLERLIEDAVTKGAKIVKGGKRAALGGTFFEPTILTGITPDMDMTEEETFGPVVPIMRFSTEEEAITLANATRYGLASYFCTQDLARATRVAEKLEYGIVGINEGIISTEVAPFGGIKESGMGREGSFMGIEEYVEVKYICTNVG